MSTFQNILTGALAAAALAAAPAAQADVVAAWNFENASGSQVNGIAASATGAGVSNAQFSTANNGVEAWGGAIGKLSVTRFFDSTSTTPSLSFSLTEDYDAVTLSFTHFQNNNRDFPTSPRYKYAVQLNDGSGWVDVMADLIASPATNGESLTLDIVQGLNVGTYGLRWIGYGYSYGSNSGSEFFALDNVTLSGTLAPAGNTVPEPASLALVGLALAGVAAVRRQRR